MFENAFFNLDFSLDAYAVVDNRIDGDAEVHVSMTVTVTIDGAEVYSEPAGSVDVCISPCRAEFIFVKIHE